MRRPFSERHANTFLAVLTGYSLLKTMFIHCSLFKFFLKYSFNLFYLKVDFYYVKVDSTFFFLGTERNGKKHIITLLIM